MKKGALELSVTAIVVLVIAFVVLGLALTFTRGFFRQAQQDLPGILDIGKIGTQPDVENYLTIPDTVIIGRGDPLTLEIGYYNRGDSPATSAKLGIKECQDDDGQTINAAGTDTAPSLMPTLTAVSQTVERSQVAGYKAILQEKGLSAGTYICTLVVYSGTSASDNAAVVYDSKQFFLQVTA